MKTSALLKESKLRRYKNKASALVEKGKYHKALPLYRDILEAYPDDTGMMLKVGDLCRKLNMRAEAVAVYANAATHHAAAGRLLQAIAVCKVILEVDSTHTATQEMMARLYADHYGQKTGAEPFAGQERSDDVSDGAQADDADHESRDDVSSADEGAVIEIAVEEDWEIYDDGDDVFEAEEVGDGDDGKAAQDEAVPHGDSLIIRMSKPDMTRRSLPEIPLFSCLDTPSFMELVTDVPLVTYRKRDTIVTEGDSADSFFVIVSGTVEVFTQGVGVAVLEEGAFFGEMAIVMPGPRQASVVADSECELLVFSVAKLEKMKERCPQIAQALLTFSEQRLLHNLMLTCALFAPFDSEDREHLMSRFEPMLLEAGAVVIREGTHPDGMYLIVSGSAQVMGTRDDGASFEVAVLRSNDMYGEMSLLTRKPAIATVTMRERSRVLVLSRSRFNELIMTHPQVLELLAAINDERMDAFEKLKNRSPASSSGGGTALL